MVNVRKMEISFAFSYTFTIFAHLYEPDRRKDGTINHNHPHAFCSAAWNPGSNAQNHCPP